VRSETEQLPWFIFQELAVYENMPEQVKIGPDGKQKSVVHIWEVDYFVLPRLGV
jgi:hypothetical protein